LAKSRFISDLHWVREGQQPRSQRTQQALLDAAEILLAEKGADATSVADVAARAGASVGAVYHHFRDKKALLHAIFERMSVQLRATIREAVDPARWEGATVLDVLQGYLEFSIETGRDRPVSKRAGVEAARHDPVLNERMNALRCELHDEISGLLRTRSSEIGHPDPDLAIGFVLDQLSAMVQARLDGSRGPTRLANRPDDVFVAEALRSVSRYLRLAASAPLERE
jgi:AcrR family transcriptional regulator